MTSEEAIDIINSLWCWERCTDEERNALNLATEALKEKPKTAEWKEIYAESEGSASWIEFTCSSCGDTFGMEYDWYYGDPIPWKACPMCGTKMKETE